MTSATYGTHGSQTTTWTSYNQPSYLNGTPGTASSSQLFYDADHQRYKQLASYSGAVENTIYVGGLLEKMSNSTGTAYRHYIPAGNNTVVYTRLSTGTNSTYYLTKDHLGSTAVITDQTGTSLVQEKFSALGWEETSAAGLATMATISRHEFTGHEGIDSASLGMVNMNGRVYIPSGSHFISPDPYVPDPGNTQSFNRYSYANNNPLTLIDPTGYDDELPAIYVVSQFFSAFASGFQSLGDSVGGALTKAWDWVTGASDNHLSAQQQNWANHGVLNAQNLQGAPGAAPYSDGGFRYTLEDAVSGTQGPQVAALTEITVTGQYMGPGALTTPPPTLEETAADTAQILSEIGAAQAQSANYPSEIASTPSYWSIVGQSMARSGPKATMVALTVASFIPPIAVEARVARAGLAAEGLAGAGSAANVANGIRLAEQLTVERASALSTATGELTPEAIANSRLIMQPGQLLNPEIPQGFAKFTTEPLPNPFGGSFTTRFYMNPSTGEVFYGLDYKTLFLP